MVEFMSFKRLRSSFHAAFWGLRYCWRQEQNFRLQAGAAAAVLILGSLLRVGRQDFLWLLALSALVLILELANTAVEKLIDVVKPRLTVQAGIVKDVMAGAVLVAAVGSALVAAIIFLPRVVELAGEWWYTRP
ncbi:MAG: hypothetical protein UY92_C0013G0005 [Candidatus Magasanikbacteria bacterium GW2011_GWA2_56_11]|uniref:Diacylglycerol kinase n=1 Tax=Candidatus Magasanikbacteria bacterium GW2011_GWA2_56_11 TaxID=1619044 RepID=A0A0G1YF06_9BACT|nr:MAG: hypothetical protein UY92_C0013G0005 [Candidatus Magasanikbacteria bacterium GW2011_GWA2_56_11]